jgi:hypothetical protein
MVHIDFDVLNFFRNPMSSGMLPEISLSFARNSSSFDKSPNEIGNDPDILLS